ncbi:caprin-2 [Discoglossus pictus]
MVQLTQSSPTGDGGIQLDKLSDCQLSLSPLHSSVSSTLTPLQVFETYLDNGFISLKHKIRNIEKKKIKLEDYKDRIRNGEQLNPDQLEAAEKYEEVIHNLEFAKELQKTFSALSQDLVKAQKKSARRETVLKVEADRKRLITLLQIQYMLQSFGQEHVQKDFKDGQNGAMYISPKELEYLVRFSKLSCPKRYKHMSLEDQMEQSAGYFWNLLEGSDKTVAGTTYKYLKDLAARLLDCGYFENVPEPPCEKPKPKTSLQELMKSNVPEKVGMKEPIRAKEPIVEYVKSDTHPNKLPVRHYLPEPVKQEEPKPVQTKYTKPEVVKPWSVTTDVKLQEQKKWPLPQPLTVISKPWQAANLQPAQPVPKKCEVVPKKCEPEPKEKRERVPRLQIEVKQMNSTKDLKVPLVVNGQNPIKKRENLSKTVGNGPASPVVNTPQAHRIVPQTAAEFCSSPNLPKDPELRKQKLEDLIDEIKGTYNFMQDSMLDFELSPRVAAIPCLLESNPIVHTELKQQNKMEPFHSPQQAASILLEPDDSIIACHTHSELESIDPLPQTPPANPTIKLVREEEHYNPKPVYVTNPNITEPLPERKQVPLTLPSEPPPSPKTPTNISVLQLKSEAASLSPPRNVPLPMSSSPFQGMQTVFKVNAPLPPRKELEIKDDPPYSPVYNQTFSTASTQTLPHSPMETSMDHNSFLQEPLGSPYHSDGSSQLSNGSFSGYTTNPNILPRMPQPYISGRGAIRGTNRGRVMTNGYRCQSGYKGPETYRVTQPITNGNYGHVQCPGRDYPVAQFTSRDGNSHLCHKRGTVTTNTRSNSRGWSESSQMSSPERHENTSTDSGHGDSRSSIAPVDMSMTNQATTILPVHVYPLPQQMRVAFSAARTSNLAPGTLDQPIVFDLLLNNLGETFDFQLGRFMCPVNGTYVFIFHMLKLAVNVPLYVNLMKNEEVLVSAYANDGAPDHETASNHAVLQLFQGDQIWLRLHRGAIYGSSWKYSTFSGYLLYQD